MYYIYIYILFREREIVIIIIVITITIITSLPRSAGPGDQGRAALEVRAADEEGASTILFYNTLYNIVLHNSIL